MEVVVNKIKVKKRIRKDMGKLDNLVNSMKKHGLINPILINSNYELLAGHRRLLAAKSLKWKTIDVKVMNVTDNLDKLNIEIEENITRKDFTAQELEKGLSIKSELLKIRNMPYFLKVLYKIVKAVIRFFKNIFLKEVDD